LEHSSVAHTDKVKAMLKSDAKETPEVADKPPQQEVV